MTQAKEITLQLSDDQLDNLRGVFYHFGWDFDSVVVNENSSSVDAETQTTAICKPDEVSDNTEENHEDYEPFRIQQDENFDECPHCFCKPCITDVVNKQLWWEDEPHPGHARNKNLRKETYKRFWTMMYHRNVWNHPNYIQKKMSALQRDPRYRNVVYHRRDIMPNCVLKCVRGWFPNPENVPYMGHLWE